jgi:hypothetical protein
VVPLSPCWFVVAIAPIAAPGLAVAAPPRVEIGPPAEGFEGWAVAGVVVGGCRRWLSADRRPPAERRPTGAGGLHWAFSCDVASPPADRERAVLAGDVGIVVGDTCRRHRRIAGVRLTVARVAWRSCRRGPGRAGSRPAARWHRGAPCPSATPSSPHLPTAAVLTDRWRSAAPCPRRSVMNLRSSSLLVVATVTLIGSVAEPLTRPCDTKAGCEDRGRQLHAHQEAFGKYACRKATREVQSASLGCDGGAP